MNQTGIIFAAVIVAVVADVILVTFWQRKNKKRRFTPRWISCCSLSALKFASFHVTSTGAYVHIC
jgi:hypothetical protein